MLRNAIFKLYVIQYVKYYFTVHSAITIYNQKHYFLYQPRITEYENIYMIKTEDSTEKILYILEY